MLKDQNAMEFWLRLMSDAMRGAADAQRAMRSLGEMPMTPDQLTHWITQFMPMSAGQPAKPEMTGDWLEDMWGMMGVVPRYRYLDLLERHEILREKLEAAEKAIKKIKKATAGGKMPEVEAHRILDMWEGMLQDTLSMQAEWMRTWTSADSAQKKAEGTKDSPTVSVETDKDDQ
jgi:hypothetical protein